MWGYTLHKKRMCVCTTTLPLFQDNYSNCAPHNKHPCVTLAVLGS